MPAIVRNPTERRQDEIAYALQLWDTDRAKLITELNNVIARQVQWPFVSLCLAPLLLSLGRISQAEHDLFTGDWYAYTIEVESGVGPDGVPYSVDHKTVSGLKPAIMTVLLK